ncbi:hypothetical protein L2E82_45053 [Cichorium intybus]|uniref:Uncharacterized protein n=1 Tax=Cichorium intybus TaxID=13427 RepID=A0ACB8ZST1_CICIN|nr:hypothetical protein L2E82_45053 [Cichorium intybus]
MSNLAHSTSMVGGYLVFSADANNVHNYDCYNLISKTVKSAYKSATLRLSSPIISFVNCAIRQPASESNVLSQFAIYDGFNNGCVASSEYFLWVQDIDVCCRFVKGKSMIGEIVDQGIEKLLMSKIDFIDTGQNKCVACVFCFYLFGVTKVTMQAQTEMPFDFRCKDKFLILSTVFPKWTKEKHIISTTMMVSVLTKKKLQGILVSPPSSPVLLKVSLAALPSLKVLKLSNCGHEALSSLVHVASSVAVLRDMNTNIPSPRPPTSNPTATASSQGPGGVGSNDPTPNSMTQEDDIHVDEDETLNEVEKVLKLSNCGHEALSSLVHVASSVAVLRVSSVSGLNSHVWGGVIDYLAAVEEVKISGCNEIRYLWESEAEASKVLVKLRKLDIECCNIFEYCSCPDSIEDLSIHGCESITSVSFPRGAQKLKSLAISGCKKLLEKEVGGDAKTRVLINSSMQMIESVKIFNWPNLKSIVDLVNMKT